MAETLFCKWRRVREEASRFSDFVKSVVVSRRCFARFTNACDVINDISCDEYTPRVVLRKNLVLTRWLTGQGTRAENADHLYGIGVKSRVSLVSL